MVGEEQFIDVSCAGREGVGAEAIVSLSSDAPMTVILRCAGREKEVTLEEGTSIEVKV